MPRGYRGVFLAAVGLLILCGAQSPTKEVDNKKGAQQGGRVPQPVTLPPPTFAAESIREFTPYLGYDPDPCYRSKNHDAADLCAQWRAAIAAERSAQTAKRATGWAIIATLLSFATVVGLIISIWQGRQGLIRAKEANDIASDNARRELRAYVSQSGFELLHFQTESAQSVDKWAMRVGWRNNGATPTVGLRLQVWRYLDPDDMPAHYGFDHEDPTPAGSAQLPPNGSINSVDLFFTPDELARVRDHQLHCYVWGWAKYRDVFPGSPEHVTKFSYKLNTHGDPYNLIDGISNLNFNSLPLPIWHNCSDDQCQPN